MGAFFRTGFLDTLGFMNFPTSRRTVVARSRVGMRLPRRDPFLVGVEVGPSVVRASVFNARRELLGKMKLSTKPERGGAAVLERVERCIRYAVDEADLELPSIRAIGVAVSIGAIGDGEAALEAARAELAAGLGRPVWVGDPFQLAALAVGRLEAGEIRGELAVFFPGAVLGACLVAGKGATCRDLSPADGAPAEQRLAGGDAAQNAAPKRPTRDPDFENFRPRDFRKAIRRGDEGARRFILQSVDEAMRAGAKLVQAKGLKHLMLAGGAVDENKAEVLAVARRRLGVELGVSKARRVRIAVSELGDQAALLGAALRAAEQPRSRTARGYGSLNRLRRAARPHPDGPLPRVQAGRSARPQTNRSPRSSLRPARNGASRSG